MKKRRAAAEYQLHPKQHEKYMAFIFGNNLTFIDSF